MKKSLILFFVAAQTISMVSCNTPPPKEDPGVKVEGKKGGEMEINKNKLEIEGKKGGELKIDSNGANIKNQNANK
jgi:hypothetical protein